FSALSYRLADLGGVAAFHGAVIGLAFAILYKQLVARGNGALLAAALTVLALAVSSFHWLARPHVFTFLGTAVFATVFDGWFTGRLGRRALWMLVPAMMLWANLHGGFVVGLGLWGIYFAA